MGFRLAIAKPWRRFKVGPITGHLAWQITIALAMSKLYHKSHDDCGELVANTISTIPTSAH
jgi:hypothetical protein